MLEFEAAFLSIAFPANHDERCQEASNVKGLAQFLGVPDLPMLGFKCFPAAGLGVDLSEAMAAIRFGGVGRWVSLEMYN